MVLLDNLVQTYDGTNKSVTVTTEPTGLTVDVVYDAAPLNAGSYGVTATVVDALYAGETTGTLMIAQAAQSIDFVNPGDQVTTNVIELSATADSDLAVTFAVIAGPAELIGNSLSFTGAGEVAVAAYQAGDTNWLAAEAVTNTFAVTKAVATVLLDNLVQTFDGTNKTVTVTTEPTGLNVDVVFDVAPLNAGSYGVTATVVDALYAGETTGTLVIAHAAQSIDFANPGDQVTTNVIELSATADSGLSVTFAVISGPGELVGSSLSFTGAGEVAIAAYQAGDTNWLAAESVTNTFAVSKSVAAVLLDNLVQTFDGTNKTVTVTTDPFGLTVDVVYDTTPLNAGSYGVTATVVDALYAGETTGTLVIVQATQAINFANPGDQVTTNVVEINATADSGLAVTFAVISGPAELIGNNLSFTGAGEVTVAAYQSGDTNWLAAESVTNTFAVSKAVATVLLDDLVQTYDGTNKTVTVTTDPFGLTVDVVYDATPLNAGSYSVTATVVDALYSGEATGTLVIAQAAQTINFANPGDQVTTNVIELTASADSDLAVTFAVISGPAELSGNSLSFTGAGEVAVAAYQSGDTNWLAAESVTNTFDVTRAVATVLLDNLVQTYDGTNKSVTVTTEPSGLTVDAVYDAAPLNAGSYGVTATVVDALYSGEATGTLVIVKAIPGIDWTNPVSITYGTLIDETQLNAIASVPGDFTYDPPTGHLLNAGTNVLHLVFDPDDAANYHSTSSSVECVVLLAPQAITFPAIDDQLITNIVELTATASSGLPVDYEILSGPAVLDEGYMTFTATGVVVIIAHQQGNSNWLAAAATTNVFAVLPVIDSNTNGIPDEWEIEYFGSLEVSSGTSDYDEDGVSDIHEYIADTDPTDSSDYLSVTADNPNAPKLTGLKWVSASNRTYRVEYAPSAMGAFTIIVSNIVATPPLNTMPLENTVDDQGFFRIGVHLEDQ